jgi:hypothetical protein
MSAAWNRRGRTGLAAAGAAICAATAFAPGTASADGTCDEHYVCMWEDASYGGDKWVNWRPVREGDTFEIGGWNGDNEISSAVNRSGFAIVMYADDSGAGGSFCIHPHQPIQNFQEVGFNDEAESLVAKTGC